MFWPWCSGFQSPVLVSFAALARLKLDVGALRFGSKLIQRPHLLGYLQCLIHLLSLENVEHLFKIRKFGYSLVNVLFMMLQLLHWMINDTQYLLNLLIVTIELFQI